MKYFIVLMSLSAFAQEVPMGDPFFLKSGISSKKWFIEQNNKRIEEFPAKYSKIAEEKLEYEKAILQYDKKIEELKAKSKLTKQEKAFLAVSSCLHPVMMGKPKKSSWGESSVHTCVYQTNIDGRLLRQTPKGKPLGSEKEIMEQGDELSKFYLYITDQAPSPDEFKKFKEYDNALAMHKYTQEDNAKKEKEIAEMEKLLVKRNELEDRVNNELLKCKTPMALPLEKHDTKISENGSSELMREFMEASFKDAPILDESYAEYANPKITSGWSNMMTYGLCLEEKKKETDCAHCQGQIEEKLTQMETFLNKPKKDCSGKMFNSSPYRHLYVDHTPTGLSVDNKDRKKGIEHMRKIIMTNLAQGLPVGAKRMDKYESIIAVKPVKNECHYQVKNYSNGETFWIEEESMFEYLKELTQLNRRFN